LTKVESATLDFNHLSPKALLTHLHNVGGSLNHMDVTELISNIQKPWDGIEAPAAHFAQGDKYERQLLKVGQRKNPELQLAFALATFQSAGDFEPALCKWEVKPMADQTLANFCIFMQKESSKHHKQNKTTAKLVGYGIANSITNKEVDQIEQLEAQALMIAKLANSMQEQSQEQFKEMMEMFKATLNTNSPTPTISKGGAGGGKKKKCPTAGWRCITSPKHASNLKPTPPNTLRDGQARKAPEGAQRSSPQRSGNQARLISLN
jgi:hypothetical protein